MSRYKPYPAYKESGVEWLGQVPAHWTVSKVKWEFEIVLGKMLQSAPCNADDIEVSYYKAISVQWEHVTEIAPEVMWASQKEIKQYQLQPGDLLICEGGDVGRAAIFKGALSESIIIQNSLHRVRPARESFNEILLRLMQVTRSTKWFDVLCNKATIVHFTKEKLGNLPFSVAPIDEQATIVTFLNRETARTDALIEKKGRFIELLQEKRQALITQAVTKGLDPNANLKNSGVKWLGQVPEHWEVKRLKFIASIQTGVAKGKDHSERKVIEIPYLRVANVQDGFLDLSEVTTIEIPEEDLERYLLQPGDVLMNEGGDYDKLGRGHVWNGEIAPCIHQNHVFSVRPHAVLPDWLNRFTSSTAAQFYFIIHAKQSTNLASISSSNLKELSVTVPPEEEQKEILQQLEIRLSRIDALITATQRSMELLKERRAALITAAVTGQIDLRDSATGEGEIP